MPSVVHWNPRRPLASRGPLARVRGPWSTNNFGDLLGPWIVARIRDSRGLGPERSDADRLLAVGSILRLASAGDVVWGTGVNGKSLDKGAFPVVDVRAVRGPLTAEVLRASGNEVPEVFGDPGLLVPHLWSDAELGIQRGRGGTVLMPNFHDAPRFPRSAVSPLGDILGRVRALAEAERVVTSSLHGIVIAEAYGVPVSVVASGAEPPFKYEDYYRGTGRELPEVFPDWKTALASRPSRPDLAWDPAPLLGAFPAELWAPAR